LVLRGFTEAVHGWRYTASSETFANLLKRAFVRKVQHRLLLYRQIYICWNLFNEIHSSILLHFMISVSLCQIMTTCFLVLVSKSGTSTENGGGVMSVLISIIISTDCLLCFICTTSAAASIHSASVHALNSLRAHQRNKELMRGKLVTKMINALPHIRTKFGTSNFIDRLTPLVMQNFNVHRIVDLLLLHR